MMAAVPMPYTSSPIETGRLLLRPFEAADLDALFEIYSREDVVRFLYEGPRSRDEARALLERRMRMRTIDGDGDAASFAIALPPDGVLVGDCMVCLVSASHRQGEVGFVLHPDHQGRGYATEAGREMVRIAFEELQLHRVVGVLERLGMRLEARLIENEWIKSEWQSELVYAVLDREWRAQQEARAASLPTGEV
jgi:RimJ/RimL family protein N-acetyltransferase